MGGFVMGIYIELISLTQLKSMLPNFDRSLFKVIHFEKVEKEYLVAYMGPREIAVNKLTPVEVLLEETKDV
jgi:hypothetical protein